MKKYGAIFFLLILAILITIRLLKLNYSKEVGFSTLFSDSLALNDTEKGLKPIEQDTFLMLDYEDYEIFYKKNLAPVTFKIQLPKEKRQFCLYKLFLKRTLLKHIM